MKMDSKSRALDKIYKRRDRYEIPDFQRQEVWNRSKKQNLIDSILRGWKIPKFYFLKTNDDPEEFEVVDGQQRLAAIFAFFDDELPLAENSAKRFGGTLYTEMPELIQDDFDDYEIEFDLIEDAEEKELREFFQRLQEGLPLTSSEKLNSIDSKLRDFVAKLAKHPFFQKKIVVSDKRYGHFDIAAKAAAIEIDGLEVGTRYDDLRAVFESQASFSANSNVAKRIKSALAFLEKAFEDRNPRLRNRTIVQSLITLSARLIESGTIAGYEKKLGDFVNQFLDELTKQVQLGHAATEADYLTFQKTVNANVRSGPKTRQYILFRKLLAFDPSFSDLFDSQAILEIGLGGQIQHDAETIAMLVGSANERYSADHGEDLFKPTNKTVLSQIKVGKTVSSFDDYKSFIENLYFLFHEGVGKRLEGKTPQSFRDVNDLRTGIEHDVDHGSASKVKAKKKKLGNVFRKYSGVPSPGALAPERFQMVQANILSALRQDLEKLN